jgi:serine/threonine protein kinase
VDQTVAHYNILERLGGGAIGDVYRARDTKVGRTIALMAAPPALLPDEQKRASFLQDARAAAALNHPNIATLFDVVEQGGRCYLAYEFAAGPSLRQEIDGRSLNVRRAVEIAAQVADALAEGHSRGMLHGDLRPETIVVTPKGSTKVLNFGMARWTPGGEARRAAAVAPESLEAEAAQVAAYLSPEQALGGTIDARTDIFSLGVVLHEMITGRSPFTSAATADVVLNVIRGVSRPPSSLVRDLPRELDEIVGRMLAKDLDARPQSAAALAAELRSIGAVLDQRSGEVGPPPALIPVEDEKKRSPWVVVAVLAGLGVAAWFFLSR